MRYVYALLALITLSLQAIPEHTTFVVVTGSYNNAQWCDRNLSSIFSQNYPGDFHLVYVNDCSTDDTGQKVAQWIKAHGVEDKVTLINNTERRGAMENHYRVISQLPDRAVVCIVDGDDWLVPGKVFRYLNNVYKNQDAWMTYGQFSAWPGGARGWCIDIPAHIVRRNAYREFERNLSHLRTYYAGLFKQIKKEDLMHEEKFLVMCADNATMFPMAEMARNGHVKFIPEVLYMWNGATPLNDHKVSKTLQRDLDLMIRGLERYDAIDTPFKDGLEGTIEDVKANLQRAQQAGDL